MAITFQNQELDKLEPKFKLQQPLKIKSWIRQIIEKEKKITGDINFVFTSDSELLKINIAYLNHNTYTDIITFDTCEGEIISGDIVISVERVEENARKYKVDSNTELKRVIIHGILHLCGYKDKTKKAAELMRSKENEALKKF